MDAHKGSSKLRCIALKHVLGPFRRQVLLGVTAWVLCRDIHEGTYYPAVSLFTLPEQSQGATVTFNFGAHRTLPYNTVTVVCGAEVSVPLGCCMQCPIGHTGQLQWAALLTTPLLQACRR